ncbi:NB-ARC domain-containing protein [Gossypium australe]|uniref:NB-ARC domain-containing protein n=1 Tax=Gossypium australe TaxID=47621 RepID=A0A5B6WCY2_9ROSI|nr:NB-ARC domain-containing protein [Gossypium australe]
MDDWQEWNYGHLLTTMPLLCSLKINSCLKLKSLPCHLLQKTTLQVLDIFDCPILTERYSRNGTGKDWHYISHIPTITIDAIPGGDAQILEEISIPLSPFLYHNAFRHFTSECDIFVDD